jgi:hypothetical protein
MFISIILNTEYMDIASRSKWYLKNLLHCKENGWILITHDYMRTHWQQLQEEITPSLFTSWEMQPFAAEDVRDVEQYFIPDNLFDTIEKQCGSRTEMLYQLSSTSNVLIEEVFQNIINEIQFKHPNEKIDGIFHCLEAWQFLRDISQKHNIPLISYSFSAIRKPHGYRQTLYHVNRKGYLHTSQESESRYFQFCNENQSFPIFTNRELIALFGKERTLPLIQLINHQPHFEMGICTECFSVIPQFFMHNKTTDDDVRFECEKLYDKSQIVVRNHSLQVDYMQLDRSLVHNDPAAWILSCNRLASSRSQIMLKPLLWNRTAVVCSNTLGFSFMCAKDYSSIDKVDLKALNWYMFGYLIPNDLMFSDEYWKWRMTNPSETKIYQQHLEYIIEKLNLPKSLLTEQDEQNRFKSILESRECNQELINILLGNNQDFEIDYNTALSRIVINGRSYWRLNKMEKGIRHFHIELDESGDAIEFYPLDDMAGCTKLTSVSINGKLLDITQFTDYKYMPKISGHYTIPITNNNNKLNIDISWDYQSNNEFLLAHV